MHERRRSFETSNPLPITKNVYHGDERQSIRVKMSLAIQYNLQISTPTRRLHISKQSLAQLRAPLAVD